MMYLQLDFIVCKRLHTMYGLVSEGEEVCMQSLDILNTALDNFWQVLCGVVAHGQQADFLLALS